MNLQDIIGPIMVGPSSSHTAGAVRIGQTARKLLADKPIVAEIALHGSFATTGKGHGTDKALVAGILGYAVDDIRIPQSLEIAEENRLKYTFKQVDLGDVHPNTARLLLTGSSGRIIEMTASSIGGGRIQVCELDGVVVNFSGEYPTLIVHNLDKPGFVTAVTDLLRNQAVNIATMQVNRKRRGEGAVMVLECDQEISEETVKCLERMEGILKVTYLSILSE